MSDSKTSLVTTFDIEDLSFNTDDFSKEELEILDEVNRKVGRSKTLDEVMNFLYERSCMLFPCDRMSLVLIQDAGKRFESLWVKTSYSAVQMGENFQIDVSKTSLESYLSDDQVRIINDLESYFKKHPQSQTTQRLIDEGIRSSMAFPIKIDKSGVGFLFRSSREKHAFNDHHLKLQLAMLDRINQAVEKAYRMQQLEEANNAYMELLGFVAHELKAPLASIILDAQLICDGYIGAVNDQQKKKLHSMINRSSFLMGLIKDYLDLAKIEGGNLKLKLQDDVNLTRDIIQPCIDIVSPQAMKKNITIDLEAPDNGLMVQCDPELIRIAIANLLDNAVKYGNEEGNVAILAQNTPGGFIFSAWNEGPGFNEDENKQLFKRFSRLNKKELLNKKGTGLGLYTTWRIANLHGGNIEAYSEPSLWAEFILRIPQPVKKS